MNLYGYVGNNAENGIDLYGFKDLKKFSCEELANLIMKTIAELEKRRQDLLDDPGDLYNGMNPEMGTYIGHQQQFWNKQTYLKRLIDAYRNHPDQCPPKEFPGEDIVNSGCPTMPISASDQPVVDESWKLCIPFIRIPLPGVNV